MRKYHQFSGQCADCRRSSISLWLFNVTCGSCMINLLQYCDFVRYFEFDNSKYIGLLYQECCYLFFMWTRQYFLRYDGGCSLVISCGANAAFPYTVQSTLLPLFVTSRIITKKKGKLMELPFLKTSKLHSIAFLIFLFRFHLLLVLPCHVPSVAGNNISPCIPGTEETEA